MDTPGNGLPTPRAPEAVVAFAVTADHGGLSIGAWLISHDGSHVMTAGRRACVADCSSTNEVHNSHSVDIPEVSSLPE